MKTPTKDEKAFLFDRLYSSHLITDVLKSRHIIFLRKIWLSGESSTPKSCRKSCNTNACYTKVNVYNHFYFFCFTSNFTLFNVISFILTFAI